MKERTPEQLKGLISRKEGEAMTENQIVINEGGIVSNQKTYDTVRGYIVAAQKQVNAAVNSAMVAAYWNIGKQIYEACGESERAEYGKQLLQYLADKLTEEFARELATTNGEDRNVL